MLLEETINGSLLARHVAAVHTRKCPSNCKPQRAPEWAPFSPTETDCMAGHVKVPLLNANNGLQKGAGVQVPLSAKRYFRRFPHLKPNDANHHADCTRDSDQGPRTDAMAFWGKIGRPSDTERSRRRH